MEVFSGLVSSLHLSAVVGCLLLLARIRKSLSNLIRARAPFATSDGQIPIEFFAVSALTFDFAARG